MTLEQQGELDLDINYISTKIIYVQTAVENLLNQTESYVYLQKETIFNILDLDTSKKLFKRAEQLVKDKTWYTLYEQKPLFCEDNYENFVDKYKYEEKEYHNWSQCLFTELYGDEFEDENGIKWLLYQVVLDYVEKNTNLLDFLWENQKEFLIHQEIIISLFYVIENFTECLNFSDNISGEEFDLLHKNITKFGDEYISHLKGLLLSKLETKLYTNELGKLIGEYTETYIYRDLERIYSFRYDRQVK